MARALAHTGDERLSDPVGRVVELRQRGVDLGEEALDLARVEPLQQGVLGAEAAKQRHAPDSRALRDVVHRRAARRHGLERRVQDPRLHRIHRK